MRIRPLLAAACVVAVCLIALAAMLCLIGPWLVLLFAFAMLPAPVDLTATGDELAALAAVAMIWIAFCARGAYRDCRSRN